MFCNLSIENAPANNFNSTLDLFSNTIHLNIIS